jgi:hypothetical protein
VKGLGLVQIVRGLDGLDESFLPKPLMRIICARLEELDDTKLHYLVSCIGSTRDNCHSRNH